jgi:hypothetical protein
MDTQSIHHAPTSLTSRPILTDESDTAWVLVLRSQPRYMGLTLTSLLIHVDDEDAPLKGPRQ